MVFPQTPLPLLVEISLDGSTWTDITSDVRADEQIRITRGRSDWGQSVDAGRCSFVLENTTGKYSPRNPEGVYFGQIGRNTPVRVSVETGSVAAWLPGGSGDYVSTPDDATLDITGDIDIRFDATLNNWILPVYPSAGNTVFDNTELIAKNSASNQSWGLYTQQGTLRFEWSEDGLSGMSVSATQPLPLTASSRLAVRVTLDVDNGASGHDVTFYTSDSISGTWTQLGDVVTTAGTTSIYSGTADVRIGVDPDSDLDEAIGMVHAAQVRDGIDGTVVANPDFTAESSGTTSFDDSAGLTWTVAGNAEITNRKVRFVGEISSWTPRWDTGGFDVVTEVEAAGVMRRLTMGEIPLKSAIYREFTSAGRVDTGIVAYWPMEDKANASEFASAFDGHPALTITGTVTPAADDDFLGSEALPTIGTGSMSVSVPSYTVDSSSRGRIALFMRVPAAGVVSTQRLVSLTQTGSARTWSIFVNTSGNLDVRAFDEGGTQLHASGFGTDSINGLDKYAILALIQDGADVDYILQVVDIADSLTTAVPDDTFTSFSITGTVSSETTGRITKIRFGEDGAMNDTVLGHLTVGNSSTSHNATTGVMVGWTAEDAASRVSRIGREEGLDAYVTRFGDEQMGDQGQSSAVELMRTAEAVDQGILAEQRSILGIRYVSRASIYNEPVTLTLDYTGSDGLVAPLDPVDDDQNVTNDVTVEREGGSSARVTLDTGALSTQVPPDGIGLYDTSYTTNLLDDTQPVDHAGWRLHLGTWDETRFPQVQVRLAGATGSIENASALDTGMRMQITNPPVWLPPDTLDLLIQGYTEVMSHYVWDITFNCTPFGPWNVAVESDTTYGRVDTDGSELAGAADSDDTIWPVKVTSGEIWVDKDTYSSEFPFSIRASGEVVSVTDIDNADPVTDTFTRTETDSWGSADTGQAWTNTGGAAGDFDVASGKGTHDANTVNVSRFSTTAADDADFDIQVTVSTDKLAVGADQQAYLIARFTDTNNFYGARIAFTPTQAVEVTIIRVVAGVPGAFTTATTSLTHAAGTEFRWRFQGIGTALKSRAWLASGTESTMWDTEVTDANLSSAGSVGVRTRLLTGTSNAPVVFSFDDFESPQVFTVTRSSNGVTKSQTTGTSVNLANPAILAL